MLFYDGRLFDQLLFNSDQINELIIFRFYEFYSLEKILAYQNDESDSHSESIYLFTQESC